MLRYKTVSVFFFCPRLNILIFLPTDLKAKTILVNILRLYIAFDISQPLFLNVFSVWMV